MYIRREIVGRKGMIFHLEGKSCIYQRKKSDEGGKSPRGGKKIPCIKRGAEEIWREGLSWLNVMGQR